MPGANLDHQYVNDICKLIWPGIKERQSRHGGKIIAAETIIAMGTVKERRMIRRLGDLNEEIMEVMISIIKEK